jgi:alpha/beta superfamily hydrolase
VLNSVRLFLAVLAVCAVVVQPFALLAQDEEPAPTDAPTVPDAPAPPDVVPAATTVPATAPLPAATPIPTTPGLQIVTFPSTRSGVTLRLLIGTPSAPPSAVVMQFAGGDGTNAFREDGGQVRVAAQASFSARVTNMYLEQGLATALLDVPSDQSGGISGQFRSTGAFLEDAAAAIAQVTARWPDAPLFIHGASNGTISATNLGLNLNETRIRALILTSTVGLMAQSAQFFTVANLPVEQLRLPVLMVHHRDDACGLSPYAAAQRIRARRTSSPKVDFVSVAGGTPQSGDGCLGTGPHGLYGREREVVAVIADYVAGRPVPEQIGYVGTTRTG